jgi:hypothetical protein
LLLKNFGPCDIILMNVCVFLQPMLETDFEQREITFMNACFVITDAMVMLLRDFGPNCVSFMTIFVIPQIFPSRMTDNLLAFVHNR